MVADADGGTWQVTEGFLVNTADESEKLARIPTHMSFWFGWFQFHPDTELVHGALAGRLASKGAVVADTSLRRRAGVRKTA